MSLNKPSSFLRFFSNAEMNGNTRHSFRFKSFLLNVEERQLLNADDPVTLTPKVFDTLVYLVEHAGHLVEKEELMESVWHDSIVEEGNLARSISILRKALGHDGNGNSFIETIPTKGYRFIAKVNEVHEQAAQKPTNGIGDSLTVTENLPKAELPIPSSATDEVAAPLLSKPKHPTRVILFTVGFATAVFLIVAVAYFFFINRSTSTPVGTRSIAVLPFKPINTTNRDELLEVGIADSLIHQLNAITGLVVRPLNATRAYAEIGQDPFAAGRELKVDYVLASNYQLADGQIRITSQLINVATGQVEEPYKFDKEAAGVFAIQDAVTAEIGKKLIVRFGGTPVGPPAKRGTNNEKAYQLYLEGMYFYDRRGPSNPQSSVEKMEQAIRLDPNFALAWAGKAIAHLGSMGGGKRYTSEEHQKTIEAIDKALALDPDLSEAHSASCKNKNIYEHDRAGAECECKRAIELDPNSSVAHEIYSLLLMGLGRSNEAFTAIETAMRLDPTSNYNKRTYAILLYYARHYDESVVQFQQVFETGNQQFAVLDWLTRPLEMQGKEAEAFEWFIKYLTLRKQDDETIGRFQTAFKTSGWKGVLRERDRTFDESFSNYFRRAAWNTSLGNKDKTFEYLEISFQRHDSVIGSLLSEPIFDSLRDDPRYADLARRINGQ